MNRCILWKEFKGILQWFLAFIKVYAITKKHTHTKKKVFDKLEPHLLCILTDWQQVSCAI